MTGRRFRMARGMALGLGALAAVVVLANVLHRVVWPAPRPDAATFPREGDVFGSAVEGFTQEVVDVRDGWLWLRTRIAPRAPGPPKHVHRGFAETFTVASGTLHLELPGGVIQLRAGETYRIEPGTPHRPHNPTGEEVIVASEAPAMPQSFGACLVQIYHFLDAAEGRMGPELGLRIAAMDPICDASAADVPPGVAVAAEWVLVPFARLAGYANYYPQLALHPPVLMRAARTPTPASAQ